MKLHFKTVELENLLSIVANLEKDKPGEESLKDLFVVEVDELFCDGKSAKNTKVTIDYRDHKNRHIGFYHYDDLVYEWENDDIATDALIISIAEYICREYS